MSKAQRTGRAMAVNALVGVVAAAGLALVGWWLWLPVALLAVAELMAGVWRWAD